MTAKGIMPRSHCSRVGMLAVPTPKRRGRLPKTASGTKGRLFRRPSSPRRQDDQILRRIVYMQGPIIGGWPKLFRVLQIGPRIVIALSSGHYFIRSLQKSECLPNFVE
jgi:hypothetical protein